MRKQIVLYKKTYMTFFWVSILENVILCFVKIQDLFLDLPIEYKVSYKNPLVSLKIY